MKSIWLLFFSFALQGTLSAQAIEIKHTSRDTAYIKDYYKRYLIVRVYECSRFNSIKFVDGQDKLIYKPNHHNDLGLGLTYKIISINYEFYVPFLGQNNDKYGATHSFDLQTYVYFHKFVVDLYTQVYRGYYLSNAGSELINSPAVVVRPDIKTKDISLVVHYVFNDHQFSFNAPFLQDEIQRKSAGSFLLGGGIYHNDGHADSSFIPDNTRDINMFQNYHFNSFSYTGIGINGGYAYSLIIKKHFFITGAVSGGVGGGYSVIADDADGRKNNKLGVQYVAIGKFAAGYTNNKYFVGVSYVRLITETGSVVARTWEEENTGNFRFTVAKRFRLKKSLIPKSDVIKMD